MKTIFRLFAALLLFQSISISQGWSPLNAGSTSNFSYVNFLDQNTGFIGSPFLSTTNGGSTWSSVPGTASFGSIFFTDINNGYGIAGGLLYKTTNAGSNWIQLSFPEYISKMYFFNADTGYYVNCFDWDISDFLGTTNGGQTWNVICTWLLANYDVDAISYTDMQFLNGNTGYLSAMLGYDSHWTKGTVIKTTNGGNSWSTVFRTDSIYYSHLSFSTGNIGYITAWQGFINPIGKIYDQSGNLLYTANYEFSGISSPEPSYAYAIGQPGSIVKSSNSGLNWYQLSTGYNAKLNAICFVNRYIGYLVGDSGIVLKTTTGGATPLSVSGQVKFQDNNQPVGSGYVKALIYDSLSKQIITLDSAVIQPNGAYNMSHLPPGISFDIMAFENDESELSFVPTYYPSTTSWQNATALTLTSNLTGIDVLVFRINNTGGPYHIAGSINGIFQTMINLKGAIAYAKLGSNYQAFSLTDNSGRYCIDSLMPGTYTIAIDRMGFFPASRQVVISNFSKDTIDFTMGNGTLQGTTQEGNVIPRDYSLGVNYPNPFNPATKIRFSIPRESKIGIRIYDILGREVAVLVNGELKSGNYSVEWNASGFPSGVYFCRMEAENFVRTQKVVLLK